MSVKRRPKRRNKRANGRISIVVIVLALLVVMSVQIYKLKQKDEAYAASEKKLMEQYEQETERASEIESLADYMQTDQYIEDMAKSKLGLAYDDEIIFKEKKD